MNAETKTTTCYMCACRCGIRVHLRDGEIRYIDGNPEHPVNKGVICAKGAAGIMKQHSPARLTQPLRRKAGAERGAAEFEPISWDEALAILEERLAGIRATDPAKFALFTGRDQMQALTGLFARQFGTPNYAAHGGFCSVNMAAGMIYTIGGSFWEFGGPDLDRARLFVMIGTAEDHHSNPLKIAISKFKRSGGRFISINPVRTGYSAIADEWIPIRPGTDGALLLALVHELIATGLYDREFVARYTNGGHLIDLDEASDRYGLPVLDAESAEVYSLYPQNHLWWDRARAGPVLSHEPDAQPEIEGAFTLSDGTPVKPAFELLKERVAANTPEWAAEITGIPAATIRRLALEMGTTARDQAFELPIPWTDIGCKYCAWACPYGVRELDAKSKVMKKCTLCVDRIYDQALPEADRKPACVMACPTNARLFGDVHDPESEVSKAIAERDGYALMPEWGTRPANQYLPRKLVSESNS